MHGTVLLVTVLWLAGGSRPSLNAVVEKNWSACERGLKSFYNALNVSNKDTWPPSFWDKGSARCLGFVGVDGVKGFVFGKGLGRDE